MGKSLLVRQIVLVALLAKTLVLVSSSHSAFNLLNVVGIILIANSFLLCLNSILGSRGCVPPKRVLDIRCR